MGPGMALERFGERAEGRAFDRRVARRLLAFLRPFWAHMAAALLLMLVSSLLSLAVPYLVKTAIDVNMACLLYTSDAADERSSVDLGGRRIIKKKN